MFRNLQDVRQEQPSADVMKKEDAVFNAMGVDFSPNNNVDVVLESLWEKISAKAQNIAG